MEVKIIEGEPVEERQAGTFIREYNPKYCDELVEFCKQGYMPIMFAGYKNIPVEVFSEWQREHQEFNDAWQIAEMADVLTWQRRLMQAANGSSTFDEEGMGYDIRVCERQLVLREKVLLKSSDNKGLTSTPKEIYSRSASSNTRRKDFDVAEQMKNSIGWVAPEESKDDESEEIVEKDDLDIEEPPLREPDYLSVVVKQKINSKLVKR